MNDKDILHEPAAMREIHAIRLKIGDATKNMTHEELNSYYKNSREKTKAFCELHGIKLNYADFSMSGTGTKQNKKG
jgi:hypothetical protein